MNTKLADIPRMDAIFQSLLKTAQENGLQITDGAFAKLLDERDPLKHFRSQFHVPTKAEALEDDLADGKVPVVLIVLPIYAWFVYGISLYNAYVVYL